MPFLQLTFDLTSLDPEAAEAACFAAGALSVTLSDAADQPILEPPPGATPLWPATRAQALFSDDTNVEAVVATLSETFGMAADDIETNVLADQVWERAWLKDFRPMQFGTRLWVCPHGQEPPTDGAIIVRLDPGLAFGTGTHPTTAMCLEWLDAARLQDTTVVDYGCGSGILAIAALKSGARTALCVDLDPQALIATRDNALRNEIASQIATATPEELPRTQAVDVLLANILAGPLIELAARIQALVRPSGRIALSGILEHQAAAVTAAYTPWFDMQTFATHDEWVCLQGVRR